MKAVGYFSVEGSAQAESALAEQQEAFYSYCYRHGHQPIVTFREQVSDGPARPRYQEMLDYLRRQSRSEFLVVIHEPQCMGNTLESSVRRVLELDALKAKVICSNDDFPDPLQQALKHWNGKRGSGIRGKHIKDAMMSKAVRGEGLGKPPYGYRIGSEGKLEVLPEESAAVRLIFDLYTRQNIGMRRIVHHLNEQRLPTRGGGGWSIVTVRDVLRNRAYLGTYTRFGMRIPRSHPAIIDIDTFDLVRKKLARGQTRRVPHPGEPFLLSGLAYCAHCGNRMIGVSRRQGWRRKDGSRIVGQYRYYQCQSRTNQGMCRYHTWRSDDLEQSVLAQVKDALEKGKSSLDLSEVSPLQQLDMEKNARRHETHFLEALDRAAAGIISLAHFRSILGELDAQEEASRRASPSNGPLAEAIASGDSAPLLRDWDSLTRDAKSHILRSLVTRVTVDDDSVQVTLSSDG